MNNKDIIKCLKANKKISDFELAISHKKSRELFYVLKHLEMNRSTDVTNKTLTVYVRDKDLIGSSSFAILACDNVSSLKKKIDAAAEKAKAALNRFYALPESKKNIEQKENRTDLNSIAEKLANIIYKTDPGKDGWINSSEIFVLESDNEFISSRGIHHKTCSLNIGMEIVPTWSNNGEEFEQYRFYESNVLNVEEIERKVKGIVRKAKLRSVAKNIKDVKLPENIKVLVKGDMVSDLVDNLKDNLSYAEIFTGTAHYKKGDVISDNKFDLTLIGKAKGCAGSKNYDGHGVNLGSKKIVSGGQAISYWGDSKYGYYLKERNITGNLPVAKLKAKGVDYEKEKHLIIESFSAPQLDESSGYFGGEVRLARYFDGKKYIPLTGFSVSGNIYKDIRRIEFSKRNTTLKNYVGPKYWIFKGLSIH